MATTYSAIERNKKPAGTIDIPEDFDFYYLNKDIESFYSEENEEKLIIICIIISSIFNLCSSYRKYLMYFLQELVYEAGFESRRFIIIHKP